MAELTGEVPTSAQHEQPAAPKPSEMITTDPGIGKITDQISNQADTPADRLINTRMKLSDVLGDNWQENCILDSIDQTLSPEEVTMIKNASEVRPGEAITKEEQFITQVNQLFAVNQTPYTAKLLTKPDGTHAIFISGKIARDTVYQIIDKQFTIDKTNQSLVAAWVPDKMGFIDADGKVFSIDGLLTSGKYSQQAHTLLFIEKEGSRYNANMMVSDDRNHDTITLMPTNWDEVGVIAHELGHLLRGRKIDETPKLSDADYDAYKSFGKTAKTGSTYNPESGLNNYQARKIKSQDERGAWAIGLSVLREVGRKTKLDLTSVQAINRVLGRAQKALSTYDRVPYALKGHRTNKPIPAFSDETRKAARELHHLASKGAVNYSELPSFDPNTGENLANNPREILDRLKTDPSGQAH